MDTRTIEVRGTFGDPRQVTRQEYVKRWSGGVEEFHRIAEGIEVGHVYNMIHTAETIAMREFERLYAAQNPEKYGDLS